MYAGLVNLVPCPSTISIFVALASVVVSVVVSVVASVGGTVVAYVVASVVALVLASVVASFMPNAYTSGNNLDPHGLFSCSI